MAPPKESLCHGYGGNYSVPLHVGSIFVVLGSSLLGVLIPIIAKFIPFISKRPFLFVVAKSASTGVLLSVSFIHLLGDAETTFQEPCMGIKFMNEYPAWATLFAVLAVVVMHFIDFELADLAQGMLLKKQARREGMLHPTAEEDEDGRHKLTECQHAAAAAASGTKGGTEPMPDTNNSLGGNEEEEEEVFSEQECPCRPAREAPAAAALPHCACPHPELELDAAESEMARLRKCIAAICMEFGVALHSVFVGIDAGLATNRRLRPLLIALVFHQLFEGISMGSRVVSAKFDLWLQVILAGIFAISAPIGIVASTVAVTVDPNAMSGTRFVTTLAVIGSLCAGILMYLAFNLIFVDFTEDLKLYGGKQGTRQYTIRKWCMYSALWIGMGVMAFIGKWA